jgi:hypothetical protein
MTRKRFRGLSWLAIAMLLFMQLSVAAYACPGMTKVFGSAMTESAPAGEGGCCSSLDTDNPSLCRAHCQQDDRASTIGPAPLLLERDLPVVAILSMPAPPVEPEPPKVQRAILTRDTAPPLTIRFGNFRS